MFFAQPVVNRAARYGYAPSVFFAQHSANRWADSTPSPSTKTPRVESDDAGVSVSLDVPGLAKEQLTIAIEGDVVRIESKADAPRSFKAAYELAFEIDTASSHAKVENGVLSLRLGKLAPVSREVLLAID